MNSRKCDREPISNIGFIDGNRSESDDEFNKRCYVRWPRSSLCPASGTASPQLKPSCVENSPERRGEIGCSLVENKPLLTTLKEPLVLAYRSLRKRRQCSYRYKPFKCCASGARNLVALSVESKVDDHHGGIHVNQVLLPPLPPASRYSMLVFSAYIPAGLTSRVHLHSGVEAFYVVDGQQMSGNSLPNEER